MSMLPILSLTPGALLGLADEAQFLLKK